MPYIYTMTCCTTEIDIYTNRESRCPECGRIFVTRDQDAGDADPSHQLYKSLRRGPNYPPSA